MPMTAFNTMKGTMSGVSQVGMSIDSPIHLSKHGIHRPHDRHDISDLMARDDVRQHCEVREGGAAPLHAVRLGAAVRDHVAADFAARSLDARIGLALGNP